MFLTPLVEKRLKRQLANMVTEKMIKTVNYVKDNVTRLQSQVNEIQRKNIESRKEKGPATHDNEDKWEQQPTTHGSEDKSKQQPAPHDKSKQHEEPWHSHAFNTTGAQQPTAVHNRKEE